MFDCRYYDLCCFTDDSCNGEPECPKRHHCQFYSPMPNMKALAELADEMENNTWYESSFDHRAVTRFARRIRKALKGES